jgi:hypothetical protein
MASEWPIPLFFPWTNRFLPSWPNYRQDVGCCPSVAHPATWKRQPAVCQLLALPEPVAFVRYGLERQWYSLHRFMAGHLPPVVWHYWFTQGGLLTPFGRQRLVSVYTA